MSTLPIDSELHWMLWRAASHLEIAAKAVGESRQWNIDKATEFALMAMARHEVRMVELGLTPASEVAA